MYAKVLVLIVCITFVALLLLAMRQQRVEAMHEMVTLHRQINQHRQTLWHWQSKIADTTDPTSLREAIARAGLALEPATQQQAPPGATYIVRAAHDQP